MPVSAKDYLYPSSKEAGRVLDIPQGSITSCARGRAKVAQGYEFEWAEPNEPDLLDGEEWREADETVLALLDVV